MVCLKSILADKPAKGNSIEAALSSNLDFMIKLNVPSTLEKMIEVDALEGIFSNHEYYVQMTVCSNPTCDCGGGYLRLHRENEKIPDGYLEINVYEKTLKYPDKNHCELNPIFKKELEEKLDDKDWENLTRGYFAYKEVLSENYDVTQLNIPFPPDVVEDPSIMQSYIHYFPRAKIFKVDKDGEILILIDLYCVSPYCGCTQINLEVFKENSFDKSIGSFDFDYKKGKITDVEVGCTIRDAKAFILQCRKKYPNFDKQIAKRNRNFRVLYKKYIQQNFELPPTISSKKIGRNSPCPCGSGRKYKQCCGKR